MKKYRNKIIGLSIIGLLGLCISNCMSAKTPADNTKRIERVFKKAKVKPKIQYYSVGDRHIATLQIGADSLPPIVFLHGSPGSGSDFDDYLKDSTLYQRSKLVVIDRPGYGFSDFGKEELSILKQAEIVRKVVEQLNISHKITWVGFSYGGPVAARMAAIMPQQTQGLLLLAASIAPGEEKTFNISHFIDLKYIRKITPTFLRLANDEKLSHRKALLEIEPDWDKISTQVYMLHGTEDDLIYYENTDYARHKMINAKLKIVPIEGSGHGFFFSETNLITTYLKKLLNNE